MVIGLGLQLSATRGRVSTVTRPGPVMVAWTTRLDWALSTEMVSPSAPASSALARTESTMFGTS